MKALVFYENEPLPVVVGESPWTWRHYNPPEPPGVLRWEFQQTEMLVNPYNISSDILVALGPAPFPSAMVRVRWENGTTTISWEKEP